MFMSILYSFQKKNQLVNMKTLIPPQKKAAKKILAGYLFQYQLSSSGKYAAMVIIPSS
jgi:hypothetical protein